MIRIINAVKPSALSIVILLLVICCAQSALAAEKFKLKQGGMEWLTFKHSDKGWKVVGLSQEMIITQDGDVYSFSLPGTTWVMVKKNNKYTISDAQAQKIFKIKYSAEKIKIYQGTNETETWSIKLKDDRLSYKVKRGEEEIGKVKFYPEKNKMKVKNKDKVELASMKHNILVAAPAVALMKELTEHESMLLFGLLCLLSP